MAWAGTELGVWGLNWVRVWASWARLRCRSFGWGRALIGRAEGQVSHVGSTAALHAHAYSAVTLSVHCSAFALLCFRTVSTVC